MSSLPLHSYGLHLMIDGYGAPPHRLNDVALLYATLMHLPEQIGMRRVGFPHIIEVNESPITGLSGFTFIMESHISVHTYSERGFVTLDVYSCKSFDAQEVARLLQAAFQFKTFETNLLVRGRQFHTSPIRAAHHKEKG